MDYTCIQGLSYFGGNNDNIDDDPLFVRPNQGNFRLQAGASPSPGIGAGDSAAVPPDDLDIDGDSGTTVPPDLDMSDRTVGVVDMGAYEHEDIDCNANEVDDSIDIHVGSSTDCNGNGIPDECEEEDFRGGGEEDMMMRYSGGDSELGGPCDGVSPAEWYDDPTCAAAWSEFLDWSLGCTWGPASSLTGLEQYQAMVEELNELGLPNPWAR